MLFFPCRKRVVKAVCDTIAPCKSASRHRRLSQSNGQFLTPFHTRPQLLFSEHFREFSKCELSTSGICRWLLEKARIFWTYSNLKSKQRLSEITEGRVNKGDFQFKSSKRDINFDSVMKQSMDSCAQEACSCSGWTLCPVNQTIFAHA